MEAALHPIEIERERKSWQQVLRQLFSYILSFPKIGFKALIRTKGKV
jgi:hypothetical protein